MLRSLVFVLALCVSAEAREVYPPMLTGQKLHELCGARDQTKRFSCGYYVMGAIDTQLNNAELFGENERRTKLCPPADKTPEELVALVRAYLEQHPDERSKPAFVLTWDALRTEFACK